MATGFIRRFRTAGSNDDPAHVFFNNNYVLEHVTDGVIQSFRLPQFTSNVGVYDFYDASSRSIFIIYTKPEIFLQFTGNTDVFSSDTRFSKIRNNIFKIKNSDVISARNGDRAAWEKVLNSMSNPIVSYTATTTAVTSAYTLSIAPNQFIKPEGGYTEEVFEDRSEYFMNISFEFTGTGYSSVQTITGSTSAITATTLTMNRLADDGSIITIPYSASTTVITNDTLSTISTGMWSGTNINGLFFCCFQPPNKPIVQFPFVATASTEDTTFTPTFNFSNVEDGDRFVLEVTYDMMDTGFTNTNLYSGVTQYFREKTDDSLEQTVDKSNTVDIAGFERTATLRTRRINAPIKPNFQFLYRIGNIKTIKNLFDIEQSVVNYSSYYSGATGSRETIKVYVDSKAVETPATSTSTQGNQGSSTAIPVKQTPR